MDLELAISLLIVCGGIIGLGELIVHLFERKKDD